MNKLFKSLSVLATLAFFGTACGSLVVQEQIQEIQAPPAPKAATYQAVLGKSLNDKEVDDFLSSNYCGEVEHVQFCPSIGLALLVDSSHRIETVYLYASESSFNAAYKGELPFDLTMHDTMADVEQKLGEPKVAEAPQAGWNPGLPDEGGSPDHAQYWAIYKRFGVTIVYNSPSAEDKGASINAILISK